MKRLIKAHIFISGRVQGVFFRKNTYKKAEELGVLGWIKNLPDGRVEAIFEGEKENVKKILDWSSRKSFPASVDSINLEWQDYTGEFKDFKIIN